MKKEHVITIKSDPSAKPSDQQHVVRPSKRSKYLARRLRRIWLRVFEIGRLADGSNNPITFQSLANPAISAVWSSFAGNVWADPSGGQLTNDPGSGALTAAIFNANFPLEDVETWIDTYRNITDELDDYNINVSADDIGSPRGLVIPSDGVLSWHAKDQPFIVAWMDDSYDDSAVKITQSPTYASSSVVLSLDASVDFFLVPSPWNADMIARDYPAPTVFPYIPQTWYSMAHGVRSLTRDVLNDASWEALWAAHPLTTASDSTHKELALEYFVNNGIFDMYKFNIDIVHGGVPPGDSHYPNPAPSHIPDEMLFTYLPADTPLEAEGAQNQISVRQVLSFFTTGFLVGVVRKHLPNSEYEYYYIWKNTGTIADEQISGNIRV